MNGQFESKPVVQSVMKTIYSTDFSLHDPIGEFNRGRIVPAFECPQRAGTIRVGLEEMGIGPFVASEVFPLERLARVHDVEYLQFLQVAYDEWIALARSGDATPSAWPVRWMRSDRAPESLDGRLAYYSFDVMSPITAGTWKTAKGAADAAMTGAKYIAENHERAIFALCRPPGHHAAAACYGGYSFLNNAAIAAQYMTDHGASRVAILDVDYHHGNGTQSIFYDRSDVLFVSIHADPANEFPFFLGYSDEIGIGKGEGFNINYPLPRGTDWAAWNKAFESACNQVESFAADAVVISLGVDTLAEDPLGSFLLTPMHFRHIGERIGRLKKPTLFVMEGGYAISQMGGSVANTLLGFDCA